MPTGRRIYVKACINGARTVEAHPNLPVSPEQLAAEAVAVHQAGAKAVHMHPKTADGVDSLLPQHVDAAVDAVRHVVPGLPLGVTTGFWALPDADARLRAVDGWSVLPDFASVNWHEPGSEDLARALLRRGLGVEVGIFHAEAAESWAASEIAQHCMRVMIELGRDGEPQHLDCDRRRPAQPGAGCRLTGAGANARPRRKLLAAAATCRGTRLADPHRDGRHAAASRRFDRFGQRRAGVRCGAAAQSVGAASAKSA